MSGISIIEDSAHKMLLVESTEEVLLELTSKMPNWKFAAETILSIEDPRTRALSVPATESASVSQLIQQIEPLGIDIDFLLDRILPDPLALKLRSMLVSPDLLVDANFLSDYASILGRVFGLDVLRGNLQPASVGAPVKFKAPLNLKMDYFETYLKYVDSLVQIIISPESAVYSSGLKSNTAEIRKDLISRYGEITLESGLNYLWDLSIPVLPLGHSGFFHGACWRIKNQIVVVLKQPSQHQSRWLFDIFHELYHAIHGTEHDEVMIDLDTALYSPEEQSANEFAAEILLGPQAKQLVLRCINDAQGDVKRLKKAVTEVSRDADISTGILANLVAYEVGKQDVNWWGTASNLQPYTQDPLEVTRLVFKKRFDILKVGDSIDRSLLLKAVTKKSEGTVV